MEDGGDDLQCLESLNQTLISKERVTNAELQEARKALIRVRFLKTMLHKHLGFLLPSSSSLLILRL